ncbi:hypothetical protein FF1_040890 [Malus domestica]
MGVLGVAGNGLVVGLAWRKATGRSWVWVSHSWVIGFVVEEDEATGKREGRTEGGYEREGGVDSGINEKDKGYCCPKNYKFVSRGLEQVIPRGKTTTPSLAYSLPLHFLSLLSAEVAVQEMGKGCDWEFGLGFVSDSSSTSIPIVDFKLIPLAADKSSDKQIMQSTTPMAQFGF